MYTKKSLLKLVMRKISEGVRPEYTLIRRLMIPRVMMASLSAEKKRRPSR